MSTTASPSEISKPGIHPFLRALLGLLLLLPACGLCSVNLLGPTFNTFLGSLQSFSLVLTGTPEFVGFDNFERLLGERGFTSSVGFTIQLVLVRTLTAAVFPLLLIAAVNQLGKKVRAGVRLLFTLPLAFFAPAVVALASSRMRWMWNRESPELTVLLIEAMAAMIVSCAAGLIVYSAVLRRHSDIEKGWKPAIPSLIAVWLISQFAAAAYALQSFPPLAQVVLSDNRPLALFIYRSVMLFGLGMGPSLVVSTIVFIIVAGLGVAATLVILLFRLQLEHDPSVSTPQPSGHRIVGILGWVVILLGAVGVIFILFLPYLISLLGATSWVGEGSARSISLVQVWVNSILPPLLVVLFIQLPVAYFGAIGISVVRPFGKRSEWLLLLFAPWLFASAMPFVLQRLVNLRRAEALDSFLALVPPILISIPMLVVLTLFFKGMEPKLQQARAQGMPALRAFFMKLFLPSLLLAGFLTALSFLASTQDILTSLIMGSNPERYTAAGAIHLFADGPSMLGAQKIIAVFGLPIFLIFSVAFATLQFSYLARLTLVRESAVVEPDKEEMELVNS